eukprot:769304-Prorocentrum_minimum.AAC.1
MSGTAERNQHGVLRERSNVDARSGEGRGACDRGRSKQEVLCALQRRTETLLSSSDDDLDSDDDDYY